MIYLASICTAAIGCLTIFQMVYVILYRSKLKRRSANQLDISYQPKAAVILCVRGKDPSLRKCLHSLAAQAYNNFELHIVLDSDHDPAKTIIEQFSNECDLTPIIHILDEPLQTCSLKCSALISCVNQLSSATEVVAIVDADAIVDPNWLVQLVAPLQDQETGLSTGNRWFRIPRRKTVGSSVRAIWNAAAVVQMYLYRIPWGGSLAMRTQTIRDLDILSNWQTGFCEDTMLAEIMQANQLKVARPPELVVVNSESTSVSSAFAWIRRQLLTVRLHHPKWFWVNLHGLGTCLPFLMLGLLAVCLIGDFWSSSIVLATGLVFGQAFNLLLLLVIHDTNCDLIENHAGQSNNVRGDFFNYVLYLPLTQALHFLATVSCMMLNQTTWRQIEYRVRGKEIELVEYRPYVNEASADSID